MLYVRIGPTPCVRTSQPASVSIGEPQLPSWSTSHSWVGRCNGVELGQWRGSSEKASELVSRSHLERAAKRPWMRRGNSAKPLFAAAWPTIGEEVKRRKSAVSSNCWLMRFPSYAVYGA